jgi:hypothetical protein
MIRFAKGFTYGGNQGSRYRLTYQELRAVHGGQATEQDMKCLAGLQAPAMLDIQQGAEGPLVVFRVKGHCGSHRRSHRELKCRSLSDDRALSDHHPINYALLDSPPARDRERRNVHPAELPSVHRELPYGIAGNIHSIWFASTATHARSA